MNYIGLELYFARAQFDSVQLFVVFCYCFDFMWELHLHSWVSYIYNQVVVTFHLPPASVLKLPTTMAAVPSNIPLPWRWKVILNIIFTVNEKVLKIYTQRQWHNFSDFFPLLHMYLIFYEILLVINFLKMLLKLVRGEFYGILFFSPSTNTYWIACFYPKPSGLTSCS